MTPEKIDRSGMNPMLAVVARIEAALAEHPVDGKLNVLVHLLADLCVEYAIHPGEIHGALVATLVHRCQDMQHRLQGGGHA